jgi:glutamate N-acetyltransferase/amino-acid N-acetyltransferase
MEITDIEGVLCNGIREGRNGLGIVRCKGTVAGVFTKNRIKAAPVLVCQENISEGVIEGLIVNSGNANAFTGERGIEDAREMCRIVAKLAGCEEKRIAVASTGVIGRYMDMDWIRKKAQKVYSGLGSSNLHAERFGNAITTTDKYVKKSGRRDAMVAAIAKGAGMIAPNMATMLCFIFTSARFDSGELYEMLREAVDLSFNRLTVDGDTSTNDTVLLISTAREKVNKDVFQEALNSVCVDIARQIARDGEGATKVFEVHVSGAKTKEDALKAAKAVASSLLVKTAVFGCDPNWGRIVAALGYSGGEVSETLSISIAGRGDGEEEVELVKEGIIMGREDEARKIMLRCKEVIIKVNLHKGDFSDFAIGCDLTYDYVKLNSEYTT